MFHAHGLERILAGHRRLGSCAVARRGLEVSRDRVEHACLLLSSGAPTLLPRALGVDQLRLGADEAHLKVARRAGIAQWLDYHSIPKAAGNLRFEVVVVRVVPSPAAAQESGTRSGCAPGVSRICRDVRRSANERVANGRRERVSARRGGGRD